MLYIVSSLEDRYSSYLRDDPVRSHIPASIRFGDNRVVFAITEEESVSAMTCVSLTADVPRGENDLFQDVTNPSIAVFYTIWSYKRGSARELIFSAVEYCKRKSINRFVTLSPITEMAHRFHTNNGAIVLRKNLETINYEYIVR